MEGDPLKDLLTHLQRAWDRRSAQNLFEESEAFRVFHGPGEGDEDLSVDYFAGHLWVTLFDEKRDLDALKAILRKFASQVQAQSMVLMVRPKKGLPAMPEGIFGDVPADPFLVREEGARFWIRFTDTRHPGLFLDHVDLRRFLATKISAQRVLNCFSYTGSLSVAAALGGAKDVTSLDLSKATLDWAQKNWDANPLSHATHRCLARDYFKEFSKPKHEPWDLVILDPPSFSRGEKGTFSIPKDLVKLHELALLVLKPGGVLVTSLNTASLSWERYEQGVKAALKKVGRQAQVIQTLGLPDTFPTRMNVAEDRYLKGWILRVQKE